MKLLPCTRSAPNFLTFGRCSSDKGILLDRNYAIHAESLITKFLCLKTEDVCMGIGQQWCIELENLHTRTLWLFLKELFTQFNVQTNCDACDWYNCECFDVVWIKTYVMYSYVSKVFLAHKYLILTVSFSYHN